MRVTRARMRTRKQARGRWQAIFGRGRVAERAIVELELGINRNMRSKILTEVEIVEHIIDKYLRSCHKCDDFGDLV